MLINNLMNYINEISIQINDFLDSDKKCLAIKTESREFCKNIIYDIETDYVFSELLYHVDSPLQLLYLLKQQLNPNKKSPEYSFFINGEILGGNPFGVFQAATNFFKSDTTFYQNQIINQLKKINGSRFGILLYIEDDLSKDLYNLIVQLCSNKEIESKFILIYTSNSYRLSLLKYTKFSTQIELNYTYGILKNHFVNLNDTQLKSMIAITKNDIAEMQNIYNYLIETSELEKNNSELMLEKLIENNIISSINYETNKVLGLASFLLNRFTADEINSIFNLNSNDVSKLNDIASVLENSLHKKLIEQFDDEYGFYTEILKNIFKKINENKKKQFHLAIEKYLSEYNPFQYYVRLYHLKEANSDKFLNMIAMQVIHCLHFHKQISQNIESDFILYFGKDCYDTFVKIYDLINQGKFSDALLCVVNFDTKNNYIIECEIEYICLFLGWKTGEQFSETLFEKKLKNIIDSECEPEIKLYTLLLKLSIVSNEGNNFPNSDSPYFIYKEIYKELMKYNSIESNYLLNILYRKSNCAKMRVSAIKSIQESFKFFSEKKELYPNEYFMAGVNYTALLLQSSTKSNQYQFCDLDKQEIFNCRNALKVAELLKEELSENCPAQVLNYLMNNYLLARMLYSDNPPSNLELQFFAKTVEQDNASCAVMTYMNIGTIYASLQDTDNAKIYWEKAEKINNNQDEYFTYILNCNKFILAYINKENIANDSFPTMVPGIMQDNEIKQYMLKRQTIIYNLIEKDISLNYEELQRHFENEFSNHFKEMNLLFFSQPYIYSDVQFWSEN
jgi:hypothetical protein